MSLNEKSISKEIAESMISVILENNDSGEIKIDYYLEQELHKKVSEILDRRLNEMIKNALNF